MIWASRFAHKKNLLSEAFFVARVGLFAVRSSHLWCELIPAQPCAPLVRRVCLVRLTSFAAATIPLAFF
jgi:hypothetical protein